MAEIQPRATVTGAASGIGRAIAFRLLSEGIDVLAVDINRSGLEVVAAEGAKIVVADVSCVSDRDRIVEISSGANHLVNAAGIVRLKPILEADTGDLEEVFSVNVHPTWDLLVRIGPTMPPGGSIVNVSSASAKVSATTEGAAYAASKAAVLSITRSFAYELAHCDVRVNAVCPGLIDTPMQEQIATDLARIRGVPSHQVTDARSSMVPMGRMGTVEECATVIWFLLSNQSAYMTGQGINVTGGMVMW